MNDIIELCACGDYAGHEGSDRALCACGDGHASIEGRCRDCDIQHRLDSMQCTGCGRMRYRVATSLGDIGEALWGERCGCDPDTVATVAEDLALIDTPSPIIEVPAPQRQRRRGWRR